MTVEHRKILGCSSEFDPLMMENVEENVKGDEDLKLPLFIQELVEVHAAASVLMMIKEGGRVDNLAFCIPRKPMARSRRIPRKPTTTLLLKRRFHQIQPSTCTEGEAFVLRKPKRLKQTTKITSLPLPLPQRMPQMGLGFPAQMPQRFKDFIQGINGSDEVLVMQKEITESDLNKQLNRLSIPRNKIKSDFLTPEEKKRLDAKEGIPVSVVQPCKHIIQLQLKKWMMNSTYCLNLIGGWYKGVVKNQLNQLVRGSNIELWAFRGHRERELCFALISV